MKMKWYIITLIVGLTAFGIYQNKISSPNQEILVQFGADNVSKEQTQTAIATITSQLQDFGVEIIKVNQSESGKLKIAYYSDVDVESIKKILSEDAHFMVESSESDQHKSKFPSKKKVTNYNLDIYELQQSSDGTQGASGTSTCIVKQDYDRLFNPNVFLVSITIDASSTCRFVKEAYKLSSAISIEIDSRSRNIPEVRAGPQIIGSV